jgi:tetratricopeptide (TPR) repeat protein
MHKRVIVLGIAIFLTACATPAMTQPVLPLSVPYETPRATPTFTSTSTSVPATETITPLPTIATFTPTFDVKNIVTVTPATEATCPKENPSLKPDLGNCGNDGCSIPDSTMILNYLNSGGNLDGIKYMGKSADFTGDGVKDLLAYSSGKFSIYGCNNDEYQLLWEYKGTQQTPYLDYVGDLNKDGIPELIISNPERHAFSSIHIFSWNGKEFISLIKRNVGSEVYDFVGGVVFDYKISDINKNGLKEIIGTDNDLFTYEGIPGLPSRKFTTIIAWNGSNYAITSSEPSPPVYRFQAIQDADYEVLYGRYEKALNLYHRAISSDKLEWWSKDRHEFEVYTQFNSYFDKDFRNHPIILTITPTAYPTMPAVTPDTTEYPRLAAYAYYRIAILYAAQGNKSDAEIAYKTLQQKFGGDQYGRPYFEMATAFWNAYQSSQNMTVACGAAIEYAAEHPDILIPLGSDYHGAQSKIYKPEDVCPFR